MRRRWQVSTANADINIDCYWIEGFYIATQTNQWHLPRSPNWEQLKSSALQTIKWTLSYQNNLSGGCSGSKHENLERPEQLTIPLIHQRVGHSIAPFECFSVEIKNKKIQDTFIIYFFYFKSLKRFILVSI